MLTILISVLAVLVSVGSLAVAYTSSRRSHMPVLQFMWDSGQGGTGEPKWWLVNVGTGPATNIVVAQTEKTGLKRGLNGEVWFNPGTGSVNPRRWQAGPHLARRNHGVGLWVRSQLRRR
ncbi:hypothetical protein SVIOM74S_09461 [Streptomyces violarus]